MKFLKNNLKVIIAFIVGVILVGGIVYAATSAVQVNYSTEKNAEINTVADALNDLYSKRNNITKTLLWSKNYNSNETEFAGQDINLSDSLNNYTHFLLVWRPYTTSNVVYEDVFKIQPYRKNSGNNDINNSAMGNYTISTRNNAGTTNWTRVLWYKNDRTLTISNAAKWLEASAASSVCIPYEIYGLNFSY